MKTLDRACAPGRWGLLPIVLLVAILVVTSGYRAPIFAQESPGWTDPEVLVEDALGDSVVAADSSGGLHLFYLHGPQSDLSGDASDQAVCYVFGAEDGWSEPNDVLVSANGTRLYLGGVVVDDGGYLHLMWNDQISLYHSVAHVADARNARLWRTETLFSGRIPLGDIAQSADGVLHVCGRVDPFSIFYVRSDDGGETWSRERLIFAIESPEELAIDGLNLAVSDSGVIHLAWSEAAAEVQWRPWSVWFMQSTDGGATWGAAQEMDSPGFCEADIAADARGNALLVYGRPIGNREGRWYRWSEDDGGHWSEPRALYPEADWASGITGGFGCGVDSSGTLHLVNSYGGRVGEGGAWHLTWEGEHWSTPERLMDSGTSPHFPRIAISLGNQLHFFAYSEGRIVYRRGTAGSASTEATPVATPVHLAGVGTEVEDAPAPEGLPEPTPTSTHVAPVAAPKPAQGQRPSFDPVLAGVLPAMVIVLSVVLYRLRSWRGRN